MIYNSINKLLSVAISYNNIYCKEQYVYRYPQTHNIVNQNNDLWTQKQIECYWDFGSIYEIENNTTVIFDSDFGSIYEIENNTTVIFDSDFEYIDTESYNEEIESYKDLTYIKSYPESMYNYSYIINQIESKMDYIDLLRYVIFIVIFL
jgi:hypothetical protein